MRGIRQRGHRNTYGSPSDSNDTKSKMMRGTRLFRGGIFMDLTLLVIFIILAYVFIARRSTINKADSVVGDASVAGNTEGSAEHLIDVRMKKSPDYRNDECKAKRYDVKTPVSIIVVFYDYSFHDLKTTMGSILLHTPMDLVNEIIIVDDGSTLGYIIDKAKDFVKSIDKAKLIRNEQQLSIGQARMVGFNTAKSDIVVFLDTNVVVTKGWLEPLIDMLVRDKMTLAVPHYDSINDPVSYEYRPTIDSITASLSWSLAIRMTKSTAQIGNKTDSLPSPGLRGNAMAVRKDNFEALGAYDDGLSEGGGHDLELSLRSWLCGSKVLISPCSRVGVVNLNDPVKIMSHANIRRITELWFSTRKTLVYRNTGIQAGLNQAEQESLLKRRQKLDSLKLKCNDIEWFFQHVAGNLPTPSEKSVNFGMLKCGTGRCARVGDDGRIDLGRCTAEYYKIPQTRMMFEYNEDGLLISGTQCLTVKQTAYVIAEECVAGDDKQKWKYEKGQLMNVWSQYCLMHVTDPDPKTGGKRQIAMAQDCSTASEAQFAQFNFIIM